MQFPIASQEIPPYSDYVRLKGDTILLPLSTKIHYESQIQGIISFLGVAPFESLTDSLKTSRASAFKF